MTSLNRLMTRDLIKFPHLHIVNGFKTTFEDVADFLRANVEPGDFDYFNSCFFVRNELIQTQLLVQFSGRLEILSNDEMNHFYW